MKNVLCLFFILFAICANGKVSYKFSAKKFIIGERGTLSIISDKESAQIADLPKIDGLRWLHGSQQSSETSIINGSYSHKTTNTYSFVISNEKVIIPKLKIKEGKQKSFIGPFTLIAEKKSLRISSSSGDSESAQIADLVFLKSTMNSNRTEYFIGESIPLKFELFILKGLQIGELNFPKLNLDNQVIFKDYSQVNSKSSKYDIVKQYETVTNGRKYSVLIFNTEIRALIAKKFIAQPEVECPVLIPQKSRSRRQSFFDSGFFNRQSYQTIEHIAKGNELSFSVSDLPKLKTKSNYLGLIGVWSVTYELSKGEYKIGEPITLKVNIKGTGELGDLKAPKLSLRNFEVYEPEIEKNDESKIKIATIKYVIIPRKSGIQTIECSLASFSLKRNEYKISPFTKDIKINSNDAIDSSNYSSDNYTKEKKINKPISKHKDLLYLKKTSSGIVVIPLWHNKVWHIIIAFVILFILLIFKLLKNKNFSESEQRKLLALKNKKNIIKMLKNIKDDDMLRVMQETVVPFLVDVNELPAGSTANDFVENKKNIEVCELLKEFENLHFMQGQGNLDGFKDKVLNIIKKMSFIVIILLSVQSASYAEKSSNLWEKGLSFYDKGDFKNALSIFKELEGSKGIDANLKYNIGNCYYQLNKPSLALAYFETARRVAPRDSDILENINFIRRDLELDEVGKTASPIDFIKTTRDLLRPDEWLFLSITAFIAICAILIFRKKILNLWKIYLFIFITIIFIAIYAIVTQLQTTYNKSSAIATEALSVHSLPMAESLIDDIEIQDGDSFFIKERKNTWILVKNKNIEGWIYNKNFIEIWNN